MGYYNWATGKEGNQSQVTKWPNFMHIATNSAVVVASFTSSFPPGSLTLFTFAPAPAQLSASVPPQAGQFVL